MANNERDNKPCPSVHCPIEERERIFKGGDKPSMKADLIIKAGIAARLRNYSNSETSEHQ